MTDRTPGDVLADVVDAYLVEPSGDRHGVEVRFLRTAVLTYRRDTDQILADRAESLRSGPPPPTPPEGGPQIALADLTELIAAATELKWNVADGYQVGADVIIEHDSWRRFVRALRRVTNPEESRGVR